MVIPEMRTRVAFLGVIGVVCFAPNSVDAQAKSDTVGVIRTTLMTFAEAFDKGISEGRPSRFGLDRRTFALSTRTIGGSPVVQGIAWRAGRPASLDSLVIAGVRVTATLSAESQPRKCETRTTAAGQTVRVCTMRDYDVIVAISDPVFEGAFKATVMLMRTQNINSQLGEALSMSVLLYTLERSNGVWKVISRVPIAA